LREAFVIEGPVELQGDVHIGGSKYSGLPALAAALLAREETRLGRLPMISDIRVVGEMLLSLGATADFIEPGVAVVTAPHLDEAKPPVELVKRLRASYYLIPPLLHRLGEAHVALPGGDRLGTRPIDQHIKGLQALGVVVQVDHGMVHAWGRPRGGEVYLDVPSVGATMNLMMAGAIGLGRTVLHNAYVAPFIVDFASYLNSMGARIRGAGTSRILIDGVDCMTGTDYSIIEDHSEAATFAIAAAMAGRDVFIRDIYPEHLRALISKLEEAGVPVGIEDEGIRVSATTRPRAINVVTAPYPGFFTDYQPPFSTFLARADGVCKVHETVWPERFAHLQELARMGAEASIVGSTAIITGVARLTATEAEAAESRAGSSLVLAGLVAEGTTTIWGTRHVDRVYEDLDGKLNQLGANIERVRETPPPESREEVA